MSELALGVILVSLGVVIGVMLSQYQATNYISAPKDLNASELDVSDSSRIILTNQNIKVYKDVVAPTHSMLPTLDAGNTLIIKYHPQVVNVGDIISVYNASKAGGTGLIHRVVDISGDCIFTKGDNAMFGDGICWNIGEINALVVGVIYTK